MNKHTNDTINTLTDDKMTDEQRRVQALLESGHITQDEADILFAALGVEAGPDGDVKSEGEAREEAVSEQQFGELPDPENSSSELEQRSPQKVQQSGAQGPSESVHLAPTPAPKPADVKPPRLPEPPAPPRLSDAAPEPMTWVRLTGFCGDLTVTSDPYISSPVIDGHALLEHTEAGYLIRTPPENKGGNWLQRLHKAAGDVRVRLPAEMGLDLGIMAGDGEIRGVKVLKGTFTGGDLNVLGAETVDLTVTAGDVTLKLRPRAGEGRVKTISGDVDVTFLVGSSAVVSGSATCGDLDLPPGFTQNGGFANQKFEGTLGAGEGRLELRLTAGDVNIRAEA